MKLIECPRDAMQGIHEFIPTNKKVDYLNQLLKVGFDTIDFGSFVSPKLIPQMGDTEEVLSKLEIDNSTTKLLAIVANVRGANDASKYSQIDYLGFPFSISETFQKRNTNKSIEQALQSLQEIQSICVKTSKSLVAYISMGFGNPYNDFYNEELVEEYTELLVSYGIKIISLADTIGVSNSISISSLFTSLITKYPDVEFGGHLHSNPSNALEKIDAAYMAGCMRFDGAIKGYGGCPMAKDDLVGNIATETLIEYLNNKNIDLDISDDAFQKSMLMTDDIFPM
ncbi:MAG: hydroxymethylglutaryl-CoA lyase [Cyclobacteriaceae bacterium]|nr:hydroxymethylglutaryl-CoA lyase [Cyclobacteriaceae bacterium]